MITRLHAGARRPVTALLAVVALAACEIQNPNAINTDTTSPASLVNGAIEDLASYHLSLVELVLIASDEATWGPQTNSLNRQLDDTGELMLMPAYRNGFRTLSRARELTAIAIDRAAQSADPKLLARAHSWHGWTLIRLAEVYGDQPIRQGEAVLTAEAVLDVAAEHFTTALEGGVLLQPEIRALALAGIARARWAVGGASGSPEHFQAAKVAALQALELDPGFITVLPYAPFFFNFGFSLSINTGNIRPAEAYANVPRWWTDPQVPRGAKLIDATELRLIVAEAQVRAGELAAGRTTLMSEPLLARNHVGLGRVRRVNDPPLTKAEMETFLAAQDSNGLLHVISELRRESWYAHGRRNVGPSGPFMPGGVPEGAF